MNILYVTTKSPLPTNDGHSLRSYNLLKSVAAHHSVTLFSFVKFPIEYEHKQDLEQLCAEVILFPLAENLSRVSLFTSASVNLLSSRPFVARKYEDPTMRGAIRALLRHRSVDLVHLDMLPLGRYLDCIDRPVLLDAHNVESALLHRKAASLPRGPARWYFTSQARRLERFERAVVSRVNHVVACSEEDRDLLRALAPEARVSVVPNGVDTERYQPGSTEQVEDRLVFVGGLNWFPNKDAVLWFDREILGEILQQRPSTTLDVLGRKEGDPRLVHPERIVLHGFVEDVRVATRRAAVVIVPIRVGGGTRLKVLEAMSMGQAVVSTTVGVEGIRVEHGRHLLIADTPADFARAVLRLQGDAELRERLGRAARELVLEQYRWEVIGRRLLEAYQSLLTEQRPLPAASLSGTQEVLG